MRRCPAFPLVALCTAILLLVALAPRPCRADLTRPVHEARLANGLRVVLSPDPAATDVTLLVRYDVGARDEPTALEGLAHLVEHVMFLGSRHVPLGRHAELLDQVGATNVNGATSLDATIYHETLPPERLELGLWLESDRMGYLLDVLGDAALRRARAEVANEYRERVNEVPLGLVRFFQVAELFPSWHPYHHQPGGSPSSIAAIRMEDVRAFLATWYGPANATVIITGKVDPGAAMSLVQRYFGSLPARPPPARPTLPVVTRTASTTLRVAAGVTRAEVRAAWTTPALGTAEDRALDVAAAVLGAGGAGRLHRALTARDVACVDVRAQQASMRYASVFEVRATLAEGRAPEKVLDVIEQVIARLGRGVSAAEVARAQRTLHNARLFDLETSFGWARVLSAWVPYGPFPARFDGRLGWHAAVRPDEVASVVDTWLARKRAVFVVARPRRGSPTSGTLLDRWDGTL